jgi:uncharacterized protein (TIGR03437 family)
MRTRSFVFFSVGLIALSILVLQRNPTVNAHRRRAPIPDVSQARGVEAYGKLPLSFEENQGQTDSDVKFLSRGGGYSLFLTADEAVMALRKTRASKITTETQKHREILVKKTGNYDLAGQIAPASQMTDRSAESADEKSEEAAVLRMKLVGANVSARIEGADELPGKSNYFIGNDPAKWRTNVPTYAKVKYEEVYPGIDLVYYGNQRQLEYDFVVAPGADPHAIRLAFPSVGSHGTYFVPWVLGRNEPERAHGIKSMPWLHLDGQGDLVLGTEESELRLHRPVIYQEIGGARQRIGGNFVIQGGSQVSFEVARYDASKPLVIDPVLSYSTYLGGSGREFGFGIAVDSSGNAYVTGNTLDDIPITANAFQAGFGGEQDAFVTKLNAAGTALVYTTYLGGNRQDFGWGIAVDSSGNAYVTGYTNSTNFPTTTGAFQTKLNGGPAACTACLDAFVTMLNATGSALVYSTYLGGSGSDYGRGIAVDSSGNAYVTGQTNSTDFPTANAFQPLFGGGVFFGDDFVGDAFVTKLNATGSALVYSTYLGGSGPDYGNGIAVDSSGNAYVTGNTDSTDLSVSNNFPTVNALQPKPSLFGDAFVTKLNAAGSALVYSTYLGGGGNGSDGNGIAVDSSGNAYVTGSTAGDFPTTANAFQAAFRGAEDVFATKLDASGSALIYSTYLGGSGSDYGRGIAVDSSGNAYVTGFTYSADFPTANAFETAADGMFGYQHAFVTNLNATGSALVYSTYLGGNGLDEGHGIAVDSSGNAYVTGVTESTNFPTTANAFQTAAGAYAHAFLTKFPAFPASALPPTINPGSVVDAATFRLSPAGGSIASLFGTGLATSPVSATTLPLPTMLGGTIVTVDGVPAPLFYVSPTQINFQHPWESCCADVERVTVTVNGVTSNTVDLFGAAFGGGPAIFSTNATGSGQGAIQIAGTNILAAPTGSIPGAPSRPVQRGESISIYCVDLGPVSNQPASGQPSPSDPPATTPPSQPFEVRIGGVPAPISFVGLAPGLVGVYQINAQVPAGVPSGDAVPVRISEESNIVTIAVQ